MNNFNQWEFDNLHLIQIEEDNFKFFKQFKIFNEHINDKLEYFSFSCEAYFFDISFIYDRIHLYYYSHGFELDYISTCKFEILEKIYAHTRCIPEINNYVRKLKIDKLLK